MSTRIGLIVTGRCEQKALAGSLGRVFPGVTFEVLDRVESFTSADLSDAPVSPVPEPTVAKFAASLVAAVEEDEDSPEMVIALDDLELVNAPHPERVANAVRDAVSAHLQAHSWTSERTRQKVIQRVRERCSFHLLAPMVEAYFFAEPEALVRAGVTRAAVLEAAVDLEDFVTSDPDYLSHPRVPHKQKHKSWAIEHPLRARHPKHYLRFLCDPTNPLTERYGETRGGVEALEKLDWTRVFSRAEHVRLARSLFEDIAHLLGVSHPFPGESHPATASIKLARVLRNL